MREHISYSELKEWTGCPWKHKLNYIDKINEFKGNEYTAFGTALHTICEQLVVKANINPAEVFEKEFLNNLKVLKEDIPTFEFRNDLITDMRSQGPQIIEHILPSLKQIFGSYEVVEVEEQLYVPMEEEKGNFKGFIDLIIKTKDDVYHIIDWKTCSWGWDSRKKTEKLITYQLTLYKYFWCLKHNINPLQVQTHFALLKRTTKKNRVEIFKVSNGKKKMENALKLLNKAIYNIKKKNFVKNRLSCYGRYGTCEYYKTEHCK